MRVKFSILFFACLTSTAMAQQFVGFEKTVRIDKVVGPAKTNVMIPISGGSEWASTLELFSKNEKVGELICNPGHVGFIALGKGEEQYKYDEKTLSPYYIMNRPYKVYQFHDGGDCADMTRVIASRNKKPILVKVNDATGEIETVRPAAASSAR